ncbi:MAG: hypothetical protein MJE77_07040 [Proteobacteria bacterium]|nr:hypothetical protein [Pseudomonadota bacterium]
MKLGEMLMRDGRINESDLLDALAQQAHDGARLGTVLAEMGLVDLDTLTVYLGLELGIPIATRPTLERAKSTAVRLLTPEQALLFRCVPLIIQDRQLIAAVDDPLDMAAMDQLSRITGYRIIPRVAPEIRIFHYLQRYYGISLPKRFALFGDTPFMASLQDDLPAPPLPGLPPHAESPIKARAAAISPPRSMATVAPLSETETAPWEDAWAPRQKALKHEADELVGVLDSDQAEGAGAAPPAAPNREALSRAATLEFEVPEIYEPIDLDGALAAMTEATRRGEVADTIMSYAVGMFDVVALCIVRDGMALGWKASGPSLDRERIETLLIPLDAPSMFQIAVHKDGLFHAAPFPGTLHTYLYRVLRCQPPTLATAVVISIGDRVVNVLYGHQLEQPALSERDLDGLRRMSRAATEAYVRLIAASKKDPASALEADELS